MTSTRLLRRAMLAGALLLACPVHARQSGGAGFNEGVDIGGGHRYAVYGVEQWYRAHSVEDRAKSVNCRSMLETARAEENAGLAIAEQLRSAPAAQTHERIDELNAHMKVRDENLGAFQACVNEATRRRPGETSDRPKYYYGRPDPPVDFAQGVMQGITDGFKGDRLSYLVAPAAGRVLRNVKHVGTALAILGSGTTMQDMIRQIQTEAPGTDPWAAGRRIGQLLYKGASLADAVHNVAGAARRARTGSSAPGGRGGSGASGGAPEPVGAAGHGAPASASSGAGVAPRAVPDTTPAGLPAHAQVADQTLPTAAQGDTVPNAAPTDAPAATARGPPAYPKGKFIKGGSFGHVNEVAGDPGKVFKEVSGAPKQAKKRFKGQIKGYDLVKQANAHLPTGAEPIPQTAILDSGVPENAPPWMVMEHVENADRWKAVGAQTVKNTKTPFNAEQNQAVRNLNKQLADSGLVWIDPNKGNLFFFRQNGQLKAGILDHDFIYTREQAAAIARSASHTMAAATEAGDVQKAFDSMPVAQQLMFANVSLGGGSIHDFADLPKGGQFDAQGFMKTMDTRFGYEAR